MTLKNAYAEGVKAAVILFLKEGGIPRALETLNIESSPAWRTPRPYHYPAHRIEAHTQGKALQSILAGPHPLPQETASLAEQILQGARQSKALAGAALKRANMVQGAAAYNPSLNPAQSSATAMPSSVPKPATQPTAPVAAGAGKANLLG